jgi:hypothetical protein
MWDLYLGYCEAAFAGRHIGDMQLVFTKDANRRVLYGEPWDRQLQDDTVRASRDRADGVSLVHN